VIETFLGVAVLTVYQDSRAAFVSQQIVQARRSPQARLPAWKKTLCQSLYSWHHRVDTSDD